jgi:hypothetical protein
MSSKNKNRDDSPQRKVKREKHSSKKAKIKKEKSAHKHRNVKIEKEKHSPSPVRTVKTEARSSGSDSSNNAAPSTYKLYSDRRKRYLGKPAFKKHGKVVFPLKKPHYPRMDGCRYADFQKGEKLYLKRFSDAGEEKTLSKTDLSRFNLFEDVNWEINDGSEDEVNHWADPDEDADYVDDSHTLTSFVQKLASDEGVFEDGAWSCVLKAHPEKQEIFIKSVAVTIPRGH